MKNYDYEEMLQVVLEYFGIKRLVALDTETTGLHWFKGHKPFLYTIAEIGKETIVSNDFEKLNEYLAEEDTHVVMQDAIFDLSMLRVIGYDVQKLDGRVHDTQTIYHILHPDAPFALERLGLVHLGEQKLTDSVAAWFRSQGISGEDKNYADVPPEIMLPYAAKDAELTIKLAVLGLYILIIEAMEDKAKNISRKSRLNVYSIERSLIMALLDMYFRGLAIDVPYFEKLEQELLDKQELLIEEVYKAAGKEFNINSSSQLALLLLRQGASLPLTDKGNFSVDEKALEALDGSDIPLAQAVINYRRNKKLLKTYIIAFLRFQVDGIIYSELNTNNAATGRFSSSNPNLQNIPRPDENRPETLIIRRGFIPKDGYYQFYFDYKQQEYKVYLDYIKATELIRRVNEEGADFHDLILEKNYKYLSLNKKKKPRDNAKVFNFLLNYGGGIGTMAAKLNIPIDDAKRLKAEYFKSMPEAEVFFKATKTMINYRGYLVNKYGRRRYFETRKAYVGPNFLIQGSCADFIKQRMAKVYEFLKPYKSKMVFQIHDELVVDIHKDETFLVDGIKSIMEDCEGVFCVKMTVDVDYTDTNWKEKKEWKG